MTREKPILFSTSMVQALVREIDPKTQTRRVARVPEGARYGQGGLVWFDSRQNQDTKRIPRYQPGDILWVRETWAKEYFSQVVEPENVERPNENASRYIYKATSLLPDGMKWRPSIFMPREAARLFLRVTAARPERVQDISEADAKAEGVMIGRDAPGCGNAYASYRAGFSVLWDDINAKRGFGWDVNPWVWAYTFEQVQP